MFIFVKKQGPLYAPKGLFIFRNKGGTPINYRPGIIFFFLPFRVGSWLHWCNFVLALGQAPVLLPSRVSCFATPLILLPCRISSEQVSIYNLDCLSVG